jgi:uncharacterized protein GlcG (DUF336 family)
MSGRRLLAGALGSALITALAGCSGSGNSGSNVGASPPPPAVGDSGCFGQCATAQSFLSVADIQQIIAQAVNEAQAIGKPATIIVADRVGNVLAAYRMAGAPQTQRISSERGLTGGLEGLDAPAEFGAISKALTSVYFSSEGNGFTSRTAGQILQEHFEPGDAFAPAGPLFGVQISNLPCSDINVRFSETGIIGAGTHRAPLGLAADPGGISLFKAGVPVGAIGIAADDIYGLDANAQDRERNIDEQIALAGAFGFLAPADRRADQITAGGLILPYANLAVSDLARDPSTAPAFASLGASVGSIIAVPGYANAVISRGMAFGQPESGIRADTTEYPGLDAFVVVNDQNVNRFPPRDGTDGPAALKKEEVRTIVQESLKIAFRTRAQVRRPLGSQAGETIVITDTNGVVLAIARTRDSLVDAIDVTTQKARTAAFFSGNYAAADLQSAPQTRYFATSINTTTKTLALTTKATTNASNSVTAFRNFLGQPTALADGAVAYSERASGLLTQPLYPSGVPNSPPGPFSPPISQWSLFNPGLELDLTYNYIAQSIAFYYGQIGYTITIDGAPAPSPFPDVPKSCTNLARLPNGFDSFPGGFPIYRGNVLVGGIGASGDGSDQSDLVAFLGLANAGVKLGGTISHAAPPIRADRLSPRGARLLYVQCPQAPFRDTNEEFVCEGL